MNVYEKITNNIIEKLEKGVIPWQREWKSASNFLTKHVYTGVNRLVLASEGTYFLTFNQIKEKKWTLKKGSKGFPVIFMGAYTVEDNEEEITRRIMRYYTVFKIEDVEGIPEEDIIEAKKEIIEAENIVNGYVGAPEIITKGARCCYIPALDVIHMPAINSFNNIEAYYAALFHELGHSTGAKHRLDRNFKETKYAYEELVAELTAAFLCDKSNIKITIENQAAYIASWLEALKNDKMLIITAASKAEKATKYILNEEESARKELKKYS